MSEDYPTRAQFFPIDDFFARVGEPGDLYANSLEEWESRAEGIKRQIAAKEAEVPRAHRTTRPSGRERRLYTDAQGQPRSAISIPQCWRCGVYHLSEESC